MKKIYSSLVIILLLNSVAATASLAIEEHKHDKLSSFLGKEVFICYGENSFDMDIDTYEDLLFHIHENADNKHPKHSKTALIIPHNSFYISLSIDFGTEYKNDDDGLFEATFYNSATPRSPPFSFV